MAILPHSELSDQTTYVDTYAPPNKPYLEIKFFLNLSKVLILLHKAACNIQGGHEIKAFYNARSWSPRISYYMADKSISLHINHLVTLDRVI